MSTMTPSVLNPRPVEPPVQRLLFKALGPLGSAALLLPLLAMGCSGGSDVEQLGSTESDVGQLGSEETIAPHGDPRWACLDDEPSALDFDRASELLTEPVGLILVFDRAVPEGEQIAENLEVVVHDGSCESSISEDARCPIDITQVPNVPGALALRVPVPQDDLVVDIQALDHLRTQYALGREPLLVALRQHPAQASDIAGVPVAATAPLPLLRGAHLARLERDLGVAPVEEKGLLVVRTYDCNGDLAPGVKLRWRQVSADIASSEAQEDVTGWTEEQGVFFEVNPPISSDRGVIGLVRESTRSFLLDGETPDGRLGAVPVRTTPGALTVVDLRPSSVYPRLPSP